MTRLRILSQAYFINALKWAFWSIGEEYFEIWAEFILRYIQHPSGKIRQAVIHASDYLVMGIVDDLLRFDDKETISQRQKEIIKKNEERFCRLVSEVEELLGKYEEPRFHRYKYISSMPASVYKSLQKLIVEVLLRSEYYEELYQKWLSSKARTPELVLVEESLQNLLEKYNLSEKLTLEMVKDWIWDDEEESGMNTFNRFQKKWIGHFSNVKDIDEFNKILQVFVNCWNYFPHKSLGGKSPDLMVKETLQKHPEFKKEDNHKMPGFIVGGQKISWDDYWSMIAEMEKRQEPFKKFLEKELLPRYKKFLEENFQPKIVEQYMEVADIFFKGQCISDL